MPSKPMTHIPVTLSGYKDAINEALLQFFHEVPESLEHLFAAHSADALQKSQEYTMRSGKRIRGSLVSFSYDFVENTHYGEVGVHAGVALELLQSYMLIVDDVMDKSELRRGYPTVHEQYLKVNSDKLEAAHFANMQAINVGLITQHLMNIALARLEVNPSRLQHAMLLLHQNIIATAFGQIEDLYEQIGSEVTADDIIRKYVLKSSYYTFVNPLQLGLILGGTNNEASLQEVERFGIAAGVAFQLHDDILGIFGESNVSGKHNTDDIKEGKYTLLVHHALNHAEENDRAVLLAQLGNTKITEDEFVQIQGILEKYGSREFIEKEAKRYASDAKTVLQNSVVWDDKAKKFLADIVDYAVGRTK